jgi:hypothetical protein
MNLVLNSVNLPTNYFLPSLFNIIFYLIIAIQKRMEEAHRKMQMALSGEVEKSPKSSPRKQEAKGKKGKKVKIDPKVAEEKARKEAAKQQRELEKQVRVHNVCHACSRHVVTFIHSGLFMHM